MRAIVLETYGGPEVLQIRDVPDPVPGPDEVAVRVVATALNRADLLQRQGKYPPPSPRPHFEVPGLEFSGVVEGVGDAVGDFRLGDPVLGLLNGGGYAERVTVHHRMLWRKPDRLSFEEAAAIPEAFLTAYDALFNQAGLRAGDRVLIHAGASGVGTAALQLAGQAGIAAVTTVGSDAKIARLRALLGTREIRYINYHEEDFAAVIGEWSHGKGVAGVIDFIGAPYLAGNLACLGTGGTLVFVGTMGGSLAAGIDLGRLMGGRLTLRGTTLRARPAEAKMTLIQTFARHCLSWLETGAVVPVVDRVFPWTEAADAHGYMAENRNVGKIVLRVGND